MGKIKNAEKIKGRTTWPGLNAHVKQWSKDKASTDLLGLEWSVIQGKYYGGESSVKYVTKGSIIACNRGTAFTRIDLPVDHGVETRGTGLPMMTVEDFKRQNISSFGLCGMKQREACVPQITNTWTQDAMETAAKRAALMQADAFAVCNLGGTICVKEVNVTPQENFMCDLREEFGFDQRTAKIMLDLYHLIEKKYPAESKRKIGWYFSRSLSQMGGYNNKRVEVLVGVKIETHVWRRGAGVVFDYDSGSMREWFVDEVGLDGEDYLYLLQMVKLQNLMTSDPKFSYQKVESLAQKYKDGTDDGEFISWAQNMERLGEKYIDNNNVIDVDGYLKRYKRIFDNFENKGDFPHMLYTIAAGLVDDDKKNKVQFNEWDGDFSGLGWSSSKERQEITGWLGDATYAPGKDSSSFRYDDFVADLDSDNIVHRVEQDTSLLDAMQQYYQSPPLSDADRIEEFLENNPYDTVEKTIIDKIGLKDQNGDSNVNIEDLNTDKYIDTYNFLNSLLAKKYVGSYVNE